MDGVIGIEADVKWSIVRAEVYNNISKLLFLWPLYIGPTEFSSPLIDHTKGINVKLFAFTE